MKDGQYYAKFAQCANIMSTDAGAPPTPDLAKACFQAVNRSSVLPYSVLSMYPPYHDTTWRCSDAGRSSAVVAYLLLRRAPMKVEVSGPLVGFGGRSTLLGRPNSQLGRTDTAFVELMRRGNAVIRYVVYRMIVIVSSVSDSSCEASIMFVSRIHVELLKPWACGARTHVGVS